jgi:hypothetical protein
VQLDGNTGVSVQLASTTPRSIQLKVELGIRIVGA